MALSDLFKSKKKEKKPVPIPIARKNLLKLTEGTLLDIQPIKSDPNEEVFTYNSILHNFPNTSTATIYVNDKCKDTLEVGTQYNIILKTKDGIFTDTVEVVDFFSEDDVSYISLNLVGKTEKKERRQHPRFDDYLKFDFEVIEKKPAPQAPVQFNSVVEQFASFQKQKEIEELKMRKYMNVFFERVQDRDNPVVFPYSAETLDISAGGMRFVSNYKLEPGSVIGVSLDIGKLSPVLLIGKINHVEDLSKFNAPAEYKPAFHSLIKSTKLEGIIDPVMEVSDTYDGIAKLNYVYKCVFVAMDDNSKSTMHEYVMSKTFG